MPVKQISFKKCIYRGCQNTSENSKSKFFAFPTLRDVAHKWLDECKRPDLKHLKINSLTKGYCVCSNHFQKTDYKVIFTPDKLKIGVIPKDLVTRSINDATVPAQQVIELKVTEVKMEDKSGDDPISNLSEAFSEDHYIDPAMIKSEDFDSNNCLSIKVEEPELEDEEIGPSVPSILPSDNGNKTTRFKNTTYQYRGLNFLCLVCGYKFKNLKSFKRKVPNPPEFFCLDCRPIHRFHDLNSFDIHFKSRHCMKSCNFCNKSFSGTDQLTIHLEEQHATSTSGINQLNSTSESTSKLTDFNDKEILSAFYQCDTCSFSTTFHKIYLRHMIYEHPNKRLKCGMCSMDFQSKRALVNHEDYMRLCVRKVLSTNSSYSNFLDPLIQRPELHFKAASMGCIQCMNQDTDESWKPDTNYLIDIPFHSFTENKEPEITSQKLTECLKYTKKRRREKDISKYPNKKCIKTSKIKIINSSEPTTSKVVSELTCMKCMIQFKESSDYKAHLNNDCKSESATTVNLRAKNDLSEDRFHDAVLDKHFQSDVSVLCDLCTKEFFSELDYQDSNHFCSLCSISLKDVSQCKSHYKLVHSKMLANSNLRMKSSKEFLLHKCLYCKTIFNSESDLQKNKHICATCNVIFLGSDHCQKHQKFYHTLKKDVPMIIEESKSSSPKAKDKLLVCVNGCTETFSQTNHLVKHMSLVHQLNLGLDKSSNSPFVSP